MSPGPRCVSLRSRLLLLLVDAEPDQRPRQRLGGGSRVSEDGAWGNGAKDKGREVNGKGKNGAGPDTSGNRNRGMGSV